MKAIGTARGQPLVAMVFVVVAWIAVRMMMWEAGMEPPSPALASPVAPPLVAPTPRMTAVAAPPIAAGSVTATLRPAGSVPMAQGIRPPGDLPAPAIVPAAVAAPATPPADWAETVPSAPRVEPFTPATSASASASASPLSPAPARRWSGDSWLLAREGGGRSLGGGAAPANYGASQAGAVLRYRLAPGDPRRAAAYARATAALDGSREKELAAGLSARPLARLPVIAAAELRATDQQGSTHLRPAAMVVSEVPPIALPKGLRAEVYGQAGYVGGRFATAFADGQLRVDRGVAIVGRGELRAGAGAWGGAQKGVSRADIGPGATLALPMSNTVFARVALDWRLRVAGNAAPESGPTLTLSAGF